MWLIGLLILGTINSSGQIILCRGAVMCIVGCLAAPVASTYLMPVANLPSQL